MTTHINQDDKLQVLEVALATPLRKTFDYLPPENLTFEIKILTRVLVPFGNSNRMGIIINIKNNSELELNKLKPAIQILDQTPIFNRNLQKLINFAANYYYYPIGTLFESIITSHLRKAKELNLLYNNNKYSNQFTCPKYNLNPEQIFAIESINNYLLNSKFNVFLLNGITGSGKTEVYLQIIAKNLQQNKQSLILIPEIGLTPQTLDRFTSRFDTNIVVIHSKISEKKRHLAWLQAKNGDAKIIIGTRSASFVPLKNPGIFIIDEEHDLSFKQQDSFRYTARDLLIKRAQIENIPIVLGSATPSLETYYNAKSKKYDLLLLPNKACNNSKSNIEIIDTRHNKLSNGISNKLLNLIQNHLIENRGQILIFLNRRGFAPVLNCFECGWQKLCPNCDCNMILHAKKNKLICHHCAKTSNINKACPKCKNPELSTIGVGTEKIEIYLKQYFPQYNIARIDKDTMSKKKSFAETIDKIHNNEIDILIGTQLLAKGHHFPNLTMVAILEIDAALFSSDFRATEKMGQLFMQVSGRSGREKQGEIIVQTAQPQHPIIQLLQQQNYINLAEYILTERKLANLPPFSKQILFRTDAKSEYKALNFLIQIKNIITKLNQTDLIILGPVSAPLEKLKNKYRFQLLLQSNSRKILQNITKYIVNNLDNIQNNKNISFSVDPDPVDFF